MRLFTLATLLAATAHAGSISIAHLGGYVHSGGTLVVQLDDSSPGYVFTLDADNLGTFGWTFTNDSGATLSNVLLHVFLDIDIDRFANTYYNEYATRLNFDLPPGAPIGAIASTSWEIDEPGFLFGDINNNLLNGVLDNTNSVPDSSPDDVSFALGFSVGDVPAGDSVTILATLSQQNIGGISQTDPDSPHTVYFNAYATDASSSGSENVSNPSEVPEPSPSFLVVVGLLGLLAGHKRIKPTRRLGVPLP